MTIISAFYFHSSKTLLKKNIGENNYISVSNIMDNIDKKVEQANRLSVWIYMDEDIKNLLLRSSRDIGNYDSTKKRAIENLDKQIQYFPIASDILSLFLTGENGLDIRKGKSTF